MIITKRSGFSRPFLVGLMCGLVAKLANAAVCKTAMRGFESRPGLHAIPALCGFFVYGTIEDMAKKRSVHNRIASIETVGYRLIAI
jgi:hypothetical protein